MSKSFIRAGGPAGFLGSILVLATLVLGILFPNAENSSAIMYGAGAVLLMVNVISLLLLRKGRPESLAKISLVATMCGLAIVALYAFLDTLSGASIGSVEGVWVALVLAMLLTILGMSAYTITALVARAVPAWVGLPLAFAGIATFVIMIVFSTGLISLGSAARDFVNAASLAFMVAFFAMWGIMSLTALRDTVDERPTTSSPASGPGVTV